ncbi:MAG: hypothetical protein WA635_05655, partial [Gallionella sp.]
NLYVRGALAEFAALAILPFVIDGIDLSFSERAFRGILITGISLALLVLTHNLSTLMIFPFAIGYFLCMAVVEKSTWQKITAAFFGPVIGVGLSSFYWLPVIIEKEYLGRFAAVTSGYYSYADHFIAPSQWISSYWGFGGSVPGVEDGIGFQLGLPLLLFLFIAVGYLIYSREIRWFGVATISLGMFGLFMTTSSSSVIYEIFPLLPYVQFPWRFLGPATMFLSAFSGLSAGLIDRFKIIEPVYLILICIFFAVFMSGEQRAVSGRMQISAVSSESLFVQRQIGKLSMVDEYLPKWAKGDIYASSIYPQPLSGTTRIEEMEIRGSHASFAVSGETGSGIMIPQFFFPEWQATIDGIGTSVTPGENGFLYIEVPSGKHKVEVWFGTTHPRIAGWLLSIFTVIVLVAIRMKLLSIA